MRWAALLAAVAAIGLCGASQATPALRLQHHAAHRSQMESPVPVRGVLIQ